MKHLFTSIILTLLLVLNPAVSKAAIADEDIAACKNAAMSSEDYLYYFKKDGNIHEYFENVYLEEGDFSSRMEYEKNLAGHYMAEAILTDERGEEFLKKGFTNKEFFQFCFTQLEEEDLEQKRFDAEQTCTTLSNKVYKHIHAAEKLKKDPVEGFWSMVKADSVENSDEFDIIIDTVINEVLNNKEGNEFIRGKGRDPDFKFNEKCFVEMVKHM